ncbi:HAMP domain-containing sensor histidine kinase [Fictibacillus sp. UD]|uniref:sensor histidine kinase n=1 Tax=Fictibacillus sp. UD TaxID=3038777 RepID=UPI0037460B67
MDTRWKSRTKITVWIVLLTIGLSGILSILDNGHWYVNKDYFHTEDFDMQLNEYIEYVSVADINHTSEQELKSNIKVTKEDIEEHRTRYGTLSDQVSNLRDQYQGRIDDAKGADNENVVKLYEEERDQKINDIMENFKSDEHVKAKVMKEKEKQIDAFLNKREKFIANYDQNLLIYDYYLEDVKTGEVFTNVKNVNRAKDLEKSSNLFTKHYSSTGNGSLQVYGPYSFLNYPENELVAPKPRLLQGVITIPNSASTGNWITEQKNDFEIRQTFFYATSIISLFAIVLLLLWAKKMHPLQVIAASEKRNLYKAIPIDIKLGSLLLSIFFMIVALFANAQNYVYFSYMYSSGIIEFLFAVLMTGITLVQLVWIYREVGQKHLYKEAFLLKMSRWFYRLGSEAFYNRSVGIQILLLLIVIFLSGFGAGVVFMYPIHFPLYVILFMVFTIPVLIYLFKRIGYLNKIIQHSKELAAGQMEQDLPHKGNSALALLAGNLNVLKHGVKTSKRAEAKSERLKTELITNVSHDLRTPLTSIITYTELMKSQELTKEDHDAYLEIIDRKSKRLKILIDDLFEVSKMASGNLELTKQRVDIVQLLQQAMAEYNETIKESSLVFRSSEPAKPLFAYVDGQKMWRVFDNLIGNVLKYSMDNTRVYVSVAHVNQKVQISFKNVSKYELGGNIEELFERFKRGDTSRHTDGSGLGLAIAKSIVDLHEGTMDIDVDGDLFKVTIELDAMES